MSDNGNVQLTPRQEREREYYEERSIRKAQQEINFASVFGNERRPWNSYWHVDEVVKNLFSSSSQKLLDFGCGQGTSAIRYASLGYEVYGFDVSPSNVGIAQQRVEKYELADRVNLGVEVAEALPYRDRTFDIVVGINILHHCQVEQAARECARVLKDGGVAIFREHLEVPVLDSLRKSRLLLWAFPRRKSFDLNITEDERMLNSQDLEILRAIFPSVGIRHFGLLRRLSRLAPRHKRALNRADYYLLKMLPFLSVFGTDVVITLTKGATR